ncbi:hypothetical protein F4819DRAFT_448409 [Hypoxylon fuscum]|nr:hypothetical protein F4819DRAFT_448409 [Hypoxylon fuscum]
MDANTNSSASTMTPEPSKKRRESHPLAEGDTKIVLNILPDDLLDDIFQKIQDEVKFQAMSHQGGEVPRLVAVQGQVEADGSMPIYRHPADEAPPLLPFTPTVLEIKKVVEKQLGHDLNHVLIQLYRNGEDYISEHSDKTLDIAKGTYIANVSLGAERVMMFRTKRTPKIRNAALMTALEPPREEPAKRQIIRTSLPHNSLCQMGLKTNEKWQHGIRPDKRRDAEKSPEELAFDGGRISLTFRQIGTYLDRDHCFIWGQGATSKTRESARNVINGQSVEAQEMLKAFGRENNLTEFDWDKYYGNGFDVLHISVSPRLFLSADPVINMRVQLMLAELGINYARGSMGLLQFSWKDTAEKSYPIKFVDSDSQKTTVQGELAIMLYLDRFYGQNAQPDPSALSRRNVAAEFTRFQQGLALLDQYREIADTKAFTSELKVWENYAKEGHDFIAGPYMSLADYAFWPVLNDMIRTPGQCEFGDGGSGFECLKEYHERVKNRDSGRKVLVVCATCIRKKPDGTFETTATTSGSGSPFALASTSAVASTSASV